MTVDKLATLVETVLITLKATTQLLEPMQDLFSLERPAMDFPPVLSMLSTEKNILKKRTTSMIGNMKKTNRKNCTAL